MEVFVKQTFDKAFAIFTFFNNSPKIGQTYTDIKENFKIQR